MDFDLSPDQVALADAARDFLTDQCPAARVRTIHESGSGWDHDLWSAMVELGWLGVAVPESGGGLGLGPVELAVLVEVAARHVVPVPFVPTVVAIEIARAAGAPDLLDRLLAGSTACVAWCSDRSSMRAAGDRLTGRSDPVPFGPTADLALVIAPTETSDLGVFVVELTGQGEGDLLGGLWDRLPGQATATDDTRALGWAVTLYVRDQIPAQRRS